jgi:hypothetical protein
MAPEKVEAGPIYYERVVYRDRVVQVAAAPVAAAPQTFVCNCPGCPACPPAPPPPIEKGESPWGFIAAALGGAASVLAAAIAKKFLGVSAEG